MRGGCGLESRARPPERVDAPARHPGHAARELGVGRVDAGLAEDVAGAIAELDARLQLLRRDLARVAEELGGERAVRVVAEVRLGDLDARELRLALVEVVDLDV